MSQTAILGIDRYGHAGLHGCESHSYKVTVAGNVTSEFELIEGPPPTVQPDALFQINNCVKNTGDMSGIVHISVAELNSDGTVKTHICQVQGTVEAGKYCGLKKFPAPGCIFSTFDSPTWRAVILTAPSTPGDYYYGIKTWGESEDEPVYPLIPGGGGLGLGRASLSSNMTPIAITAGSAAALAAIIGLKAARKRY